MQNTGPSEYVRPGRLFVGDAPMTTEIGHQEIGAWRKRLAQIVELVRNMSLHNDPQEMVRSYGKKVRVLLPTDGRVSLSRRGLTSPRFRITRSSTWEGDINPWREKERLPLLQGGLFARLIYSDEAKIIDELEISADDPAALISPASARSWPFRCSIKASPSTW